MAVILKDQDGIAKLFKAQLEQLGCPFTEDVEESWVTEMMFKPGEPRIRLLQWLFSRFDPKLSELLDPHNAPANLKMDSRIQRLLFVASNIGLCSPDDADLIRGVTSITKQTAFMTQLLDMVCILDSSEDPHQRAMMSPGIVSDGVDTTSQFIQDCDLVDKLASETHMDQLFATHFKVLPPDIKKHMERNSDIPGFSLDSGELPPLPEMETLLQTAEALAREVVKQNEILTELKQMFKYEGVDQQATAKINKSLKLVLCEMTQLVMGFAACFETELKQWCNKEPPKLGELGPAFKRVHGLLSQFTGLLSGLGSIKQSHVQLCNEMKLELVKISQHIKGNEGTKFSSSIQECVHILEESLERLETQIASSSIPMDNHATVNQKVSTFKPNS